MKLIYIAAFLTASVAHSACLIRDKTFKADVLDLQVSNIKKSIVIDKSSSTLDCASGNSCEFLRGDIFEFNANGKVSWKRLNSSGKLEAYQALEVSMLTSKTTDEKGTVVGTVSYLKSKPAYGYEFYFLYNGSLTCKLVDKRYEKNKATDICRTYTIEAFKAPIAPSTTATLLGGNNYVRPDASAAIWQQDGCGGGTEPATGGGSEPP